MEPVLQVIIGAASITTAAGAVWAARYAKKGFIEARASHRILTGEDEVESDDGLVGRVDDLEVDVVEVEEDVEELEQKIPADVLTDGGRRER